MATPSPKPSMSYAQANLIARDAVLRNSIERWQSIYSNTFTTGAGTIINIPVQNVGLIKKFVVELQATISGSAGVTHTLTQLGLANFFSQVVFTDLSNYTRVNTAGWHLTAVASAKNRFSFAGAITASDSPFGYGANFTSTQTAPLTITASAASNNIFGLFEIPIAYSDLDLRGAIYAGVVSATMNIQLTVNPNLFATSTGDPVLAVYQSSSATLATLPSFTINIYQVYLDQLPVGEKGVILPFGDISTAYLFNNITYTGMSANQDFQIPYANFREFMSTTVIYNNNGNLNLGTDITRFSIQSANLVNIIQHDVAISAMWSRLRLTQDFPAGTYYWDHRSKPIDTVQYGNMALIITPSNVGSATSAFYVGFEALGVINSVTNAGSLYGV